MKKRSVCILLIFLLAACGSAVTPSPVPATATLIAPTATRILPTETPVPPTETPVPTDTPVPPAATPKPTPAATATATEMPESIPIPELGAGARTYGGKYNDVANDVLLLDDGGMLIAGQANNTGPSHRITPGNARLIRIDPEGEIVWEKDYGGEVDALFCSLIQVGDDEYVVLGDIAASYERDETDFYLVKIDGEGNEIWSHTYGGRGMDIAEMVRQTADGGLILVGDRADEFPTRDVYQSNVVLIKTDAEGNEVWTRTYGHKILYLGWGVAQTPDGGYVLTGWEAKTIDDRDVILIKTDESGRAEWSRTWDLSPGRRDGGFDLILTSNGYVVIACIQSMGTGSPSAVLIKVDLAGNEIWNKLIGDEGVGNTFWHIMEDSDGGYVMSGDTHLGKVPATGEDIHGGLVIKTDADGEILWQNIFGGGQYQQVSFGSAAVLPNGEYIFVGRVTRGGEKYGDMLRLKLTPDTSPSPSPAPPPAPPTAANLLPITPDNAADVELLRTIEEQQGKVWNVAFSGDGAYLASADRDSINVWEVSSGQEAFAFGIRELDLNSFTFSPDSRLLATAQTIWDVPSQRAVRTLPALGFYVHAAFSPDRAWLAVSGGQPIKLLDVASGQVVRTFEAQADNDSFNIVFSPDGTLLADSGHDGRIRLWDVASGQVARTLAHGTGNDIHDIAFSPDGELLVSVGTDYTVRLWDVASGQTLHTMRHSDGLYGVAFSPDGRLVASASCDRTVKLWDVASGRMVSSLRHGDEVTSVAFSPDGSLLASGAYDSQVYLWAIPR